MPPATAHWQIDDGLARLRSGGMQLDVEYRRPDLGVTRIGAESRILDANLFRLVEQRQLEACGTFVRGNDFVVSYRGSHAEELQFYWRLLMEPKRQLGFELIVSLHVTEPMQRPKLEFESILNTRSIWYSGDDTAKNDVVFEEIELTGKPGILSRYPDTGLSCIQMVLLQDELRTFVRRDEDSVSLHQQITLGQLEKGVIRRCRLRVCFVSTEDDIASLKTCYEEFLRSPVPLSV